MKNLILVALLVVVGTSTAFAKAISLSDMQKTFPNLNMIGHEGKDYTCMVVTTWLENGDLKVEMLSQYKNGRAYTSEAVLAKSKGAEAKVLKYEDGYAEYEVSQSEIILEEDDYSVRAIDSFQIHTQDGKITYVELAYFEVNDVSDPHENIYRCDFE